jgi:SAM-dependent methyltransferase
VFRLIDPRLPRPVRRWLRGQALLARARRWYRHDAAWWDFNYGRGRKVYATAPYELAKQAHILSLLGERRFSRAFEPGCAEGAFTLRLAERCDELVAVDISAVAVQRARANLSGHPNVRIERRALPDQIPDGPFDLIVCSDVLYYFDEATLRGLVRALRQRLAPGGVFIALHYRPDIDQAITGEAVHDVLPELLGLQPSASYVGPRYRLDRFDAPRRGDSHLGQGHPAQAV